MRGTSKAFTLKHVACYSASSVNREEHECQYEDWLRGHEDSPCAKAAPLLFDYHEAIAQCRKQDYKTFCETKRQCEWYVTLSSTGLSSKWSLIQVFRA